MPSGRRVLSMMYSSCKQGSTPSSGHPLSGPRHSIDEGSSRINYRPGRTTSRGNLVAAGIADESLHAGSPALRERIQRPWDTDSETWAAPGLAACGLPPIEREPLRLTLRRPHTSDTNSSSAPNYYPALSALNAGEAAFYHDEPRPTGTISVTVHDLGARVKRRLSSMMWRREPNGRAAHSPIQSEPQQPCTSGAQTSDLAESQGPTHRHNTSIGGWSFVTGDDAQSNMHAEQYGLHRLSTIRTEGEEHNPVEDHRPLLGPRPIYATDNGFGQAVSPRTASTPTVAAVSPTMRRKPSMTKAALRRGSPSPGRLHEQPSKENLRTRPLLARLSTAVSKAEASDALDQEATSARFDSAYGATPVSARPFDKRSDEGQQQSLAKASPISPSGDRGRPRLRETISSPLVVSTNAPQRPRPESTRRQSMFSFGHSRSESASPNPATHKSADLAAIASVAGTTLQMSKFIF